MNGEISKQPEFKSDIGWDWAIPPMRIEGENSVIVGSSVIIMIEPSKTQPIAVHLAYTKALPTEEDKEYRVIALDVEGKRYQLKSNLSGSSRDDKNNIIMTMLRFSGGENIDPNNAYLGVEAKRK